MVVTTTTWLVPRDSATHQVYVLLAKLLHMNCRCRPVRVTVRVPAYTATSKKEIVISDSATTVATRATATTPAAAAAAIHL